jgi:Sulfotransferase family
MQNEYVKVVILGAARSGTNILRDVMTSIPRIGTWNCDEINPIWRHFNALHPSDALTSAEARPEVMRFIRRRFDRLARRQHLSVVVEKTCANTLRVPFVDAVLPDAQYIYVVRDGRDAVASAMAKWTAPPDLGYLLKKARYLPLSDLPVFCFRFLNNQLRRLLNSERRIRNWGPCFEGMDDLARRVTLEELCARQWQASIDSTDRALEQIDPSRVHRLRYEDFVAAPEAHMGGILRFLDLDAEVVVPGVSAVHRDSIGRWRRVLSPSGLQTVMDIICPTLKRHGYTLQEDT